MAKALKRKDQPVHFADLKVGYALYRLYWRNLDHANKSRSLGGCHPDKLQIEFYDGLPPSRGASVILHEIEHAVNDLAGIDDGSIPKTEEHLTETQASAWSCVMADNPTLMHWLIDAFHSEASTIREAWEGRK